MRGGGWITQRINRSELSVPFQNTIRSSLTVLGFEGSEATGKPGDGGVDARGDLTVSNLGPIKIFVQAKRYQLGSKVRANDVRKLRQSIPNDGQGAFITTADYQAKTTDVALETGFSRIGLINGHQLVDLLIEHWGSIPQGFQERPGLKTRIGTPMTILTGGHTEKAVLAGLRRSGRTGAAWD